MDNPEYYQMVCSSGSRSWRGIVDWLGEQRGHEFMNGDRITRIDQFQILPMTGGWWRVVATCTVERNGHE